MRRRADAQALKLRNWLANDMEQVFAEMLDPASRAASAVYHLTDMLWALPAFEAFGRKHGDASLAIVYDAHTTARKGKPPLPSPNQPAVDALQGLATLAPRDKTHIMHDKFIVTDAPSNPAPARVLTGSANFTTEGLTEQANVLHAFDSPALAALYDRAHALAANPPIAETARLSPGWSAPMTIGSAQVRVAFSPEPTGSARRSTRSSPRSRPRSIGVVLPVHAVPTRRCATRASRPATRVDDVRAGEQINVGSATKADAAQQAGQTLDAATLANLELYHRQPRQPRRDRRRVLLGGDGAAGLRAGVAAVSGRAGAGLSARRDPSQVHRRSTRRGRIRSSIRAQRT